MNMIALTLEHLLLLLNSHSPYQEVRAVVDPEDDPTIPVGDIPSIFSGNNLGGFNFHWVLQLSKCFYICGKAWAKTIPCWANHKGQKVWYQYR
nr:CIC_HP1_G0012550.mRNA.1.CDS.1 [Saccharomyces cerevisiae]